MRIKTEVVVGEARTQLLIVSDPVTFHTPVYSLLDAVGEVSIDHCLVCTDKVLFNGTLTENLIYKERPHPATGEGRILYHELKLPFSGFVALPGAKPGDNCQVESAGVGGGNFLVPLMADAAGIRIAVEKAIVEVKLKVTRVEQVAL